MISVRHVTASGRLDEGWEYTAGAVHVCVPMGARMVSLVVHVCSKERPRLGAHPLVRLDGESWIIMPARYVRAFPNRVETLQPINCPIGDIFTPGEQIALTATPLTVTIELEAL